MATVKCKLTIKTILQEKNHSFPCVIKTPDKLEPYINGSVNENVTELAGEMLLEKQEVVRYVRVQSSANSSIEERSCKSTIKHARNRIKDKTLLLPLNFPGHVQLQPSHRQDESVTLTQIIEDLPHYVKLDNTAVAMVAGFTKEVPAGTHLEVKGIITNSDFETILECRSRFGVAYTFKDELNDIQPVTFTPLDDPKSYSFKELTSTVSLPKDVIVTYPDKQDIVEDNFEKLNDLRALFDEPLQVIDDVDREMIIAWVKRSVSEYNTVMKAVLIPMHILAKIPAERMVFENKKRHLAYIQTEYEQSRDLAFVHDKLYYLEEDGSDVTWLRATPNIISSNIRVTTPIETDGIAPCDIDTSPPIPERKPMVHASQELDEHEEVKTKQKIDWKTRLKQKFQFKKSKEPKDEVKIRGHATTTLGRRTAAIRRTASEIFTPKTFIFNTESSKCEQSDLAEDKQTNTTKILTQLFTRSQSVDSPSDGFSNPHYQTECLSELPETDKEHKYENTKPKVSEISEQQPQMQKIIDKIEQSWNAIIKQHDVAISDCPNKQTVSGISNEHDITKQTMLNSSEHQHNLKNDSGESNKPQHSTYDTPVKRSDTTEHQLKLYEEINHHDKTIVDGPNKQNETEDEPGHYEQINVCKSSTKDLRKNISEKKNLGFEKVHDELRSEFKTKTKSISWDTLKPGFLRSLSISSLKQPMYTGGSGSLPVDDVRTGKHLSLDRSKNDNRPLPAIPDSEINHETMTNLETLADGNESSQNIEASTPLSNPTEIGTRDHTSVDSDKSCDIFYRYTVEELHKCFKMCALDTFADSCKENKIDGAFLKGYDLNNFKSEPFCLNHFQVLKLQKIIFDGWRPS